MATASVLIADLARDFGKDTPAAKGKIGQWIGDITVDLLSQDLGRFMVLSRSTVLTFSSGQQSKRLPPDFNTAKKSAAQVSAASGGTFVARVFILGKTSVQNRQAEGRYAGYRLGYVENLPGGSDGPGYYLILAGAPAETIYMDFPYYRIPTVDDTDLIVNTDIVKQGVRKKAGEFIGQQQADFDGVIYERMKSGFRESPEQVITYLIVEPNIRVRKTNRKMHRIAAGL